MKLVLSGNTVIGHGENLIPMGCTVIDTDSGKIYENATIAECENCPKDLDIIGYEYHAGVFVPCHPYGSLYTKKQFEDVMAYVLALISPEEPVYIYSVDITNDAEERCTVSYYNENYELTTADLEGISTLNITVPKGTDIDILSAGNNEMHIANYSDTIALMSEDWVDVKQRFVFRVNGDGEIYFD